MQKCKKYRVIGMMSGTSLDGVDLAFSQYQLLQKWNFNLMAAKTYQYPQELIQSINVMQNVNTSFLSFKKEEIKYSQFIAETILQFIQEFSLKDVHFIAIHGHTIFHHPKQKITIQVANLNTITALTKIDVVGNFRELDVMRGGEGAPLAPFGQELFQGDIFINLGGVANIGSCKRGWDIMYCNLFLNSLAKMIDNSEYDKNGEMGRRGKNNKDVEKYLDANWKVKEQNSLQRQIFEELLSKLLNKFIQTSKEDILNTYYHHLANCITQSVKRIKQICKDSFKQQEETVVVLTGGGAKNQFLVDLLLEKKIKGVDIVIPHKNIVEFKEAILFGFLAIKFMQNMKNCSKGIGGCLVKG